MLLPTAASFLFSLLLLADPLHPCLLASSLLPQNESQCVFSLPLLLSLFFRFFPTLPYCLLPSPPLPNSPNPLLSSPTLCLLDPVLPRFSKPSIVERRRATPSALGESTRDQYVGDAADGVVVLCRHRQRHHFIFGCVRREKAEQLPLQFRLRHKINLPIQCTSET